MSQGAPSIPNDLNAFWMPFTANRQFKKNPRMFVGARDMHYTTADGRQVLDGTAGLWCVNAGHCRPLITEAIQRQAAELDYAPAFQMGHPKAFELANRLVDLAPDGLDGPICRGGPRPIGSFKQKARSPVSNGSGFLREDAADRKVRG